VLDETQQPITIALGITTLLALVGVAAHWVMSDEYGRRLARIGLVAAQFGLALAAFAVVQFAILPTDPGQRQLVLGVGLLLLLVVALGFTAGLAQPRAGRAFLQAGNAPPPSAPRRGGVTATTFVVLTATLLVAAALGFAGLTGLPKDRFPQLETVILLVSGFVTVTLLLYIGAVLLQTVGVGNRRAAFGMPEGSIRALIAMSLILIFAIIGIAVFQAATPSMTFQSVNVSQTEIDSLDPDEILRIERVSPAPGGEERFNVTTRVSLPPAAQDFGLQLLTTVSTLVVAVAGFYFGSQSVAQASKAARSGQSASSLELLTPAPYTSLTEAGDPPTWQSVPITLAVSPGFVDLAPAIHGDPEGTIERTGVGAYRYTPKSPGRVVAITFTMPPPYAGAATLVLTTPEPPPGAGP
jgi:hypothetical protein